MLSVLLILTDALIYRSSIFISGEEGESRTMSLVLIGLIIFAVVYTYLRLAYVRYRFRIARFLKSEKKQQTSFRRLSNQAQTRG
jgi:hypothetical protein